MGTQLVLTFLGRQCILVLYRHPAGSVVSTPSTVFLLPRFCVREQKCFTYCGFLISLQKSNTHGRDNIKIDIEEKVSAGPVTSSCGQGN